MNDFSEDIWRACVRYGLHRGEWKAPIILRDTTVGISVELDGKTYPMKDRAEVAAFQRKVWADDAASASRTSGE